MYKETEKSYTERNKNTLDTKISLTHQQIVNYRIQLTKSNPSSMIDWDLAKQKLNF